MTQEKKFIEASELYFPIDTNCNYKEKLLVDIKYRREYFIEGCEYQLKEQENFAIGFAEWCENNYFRMGRLSFWYESQDWDNRKKFTTKELLEIYKETL